jgi:hypothetical protein
MNGKLVLSEHAVSSSSRTKHFGVIDARWSIRLIAPDVCLQQRKFISL